MDDVGLLEVFFRQNRLGKSFSVHDDPGIRQIEKMLITRKRLISTVKLTIYAEHLQETLVGHFTEENRFCSVEPPKSRL